MVTWPDGIYLTDRGPQGFALRRSSKPFRSCGLTRVLPGTERLPSIFETGRHKNAGQSRHVISIPTPDAYILSVHPDNVSGRKPRKGDARVTEADRALLAERFGIALTPSP